MQEKNLYTGFHAVEERIKRAIKEHTEADLSLSFSNPGPRVKKILQLAKDAGIPCEEAAEDVLDQMVRTLPENLRDHRGLVLSARGSSLDKTQVQLSHWLSVPRESATVVMLDGVTDPHNVGAILRSCDQLGADLLIVPERRSASDIARNDTIARSSAGASEYVKSAVVTNLVRAAGELKEAGFWLYGADARGTPADRTPFSQKTCIIMGSEGSGISRLLSEQCDTLVAIPTGGHIDSLNVSVAAGILLYERQRQLSS